eukprot:12036343-Heterocapsa_arctica.AAC.1
MRLVSVSGTMGRSAAVAGVARGLPVAGDVDHRGPLSGRAPDCCQDRVREHPQEGDHGVDVATAGWGLVALLWELGRVQ